MHPFLDGNGRVGRSLLSLLLCAWGLLPQPHQIREEVYITDGQIHPKFRAKDPLRRVWVPAV